MAHFKRTLPILSILLLLLTGCGTNTGSGPRSWIDMPLDRTRHNLDPIRILAHASSTHGVASFRFTIDDDVIEEVAVRGGRFESAETSWTPPEAGIYTLGVIATDGNGEPGGLATSILYVGDAGPDTSGFGDRMYGACEGVEAMLFEAHPGAIPPGACTVVVWEVAAPEGWSIILEGDQVEPWGETPFCFELTTALKLSIETPEGECSKFIVVDVSEDFVPPPADSDEVAVFFIAEPEVIPRGTCAELYWEVGMPEPYEVTLEEELVEPAMGREVCPEETTTYHLVVHRPGEPVERSVTIEVLDEGEQPGPSGGPGPTTTTHPPAPDTTPPTISNPSVDPDDWIYDVPGGCTPNAFYISVEVTDAGGVASVILDWDGNGVRSGPATLNPIGGNLYVHSLGAFMQPGSLNGFSITATDNASNSSTVTPSWNLDIENCGG